MTMIRSIVRAAFHVLLILAATLMIHVQSHVRFHLATPTLFPRRVVHSLMTRQYSLVRFLLVKVRQFEH
jgi:hypothetical protein